MKPKSADDQWGLSEEVQTQLRNCFHAEPKIQRVFLFGSRAMGNYKLGSDIDLALDAPEMSFNEWLAFQLKLDELLLAYKIDTILLHFVDQNDLKEHIHRVGVVFFERGCGSSGTLS